MQHISITYTVLNTEMFICLSKICSHFSAAFWEKIQECLGLFHTSQDPALGLVIARLERGIFVNWRRSF